MTTADALVRVLESPEVSNGGIDPANVVDVLARVAKSGDAIADAIFPTQCISGRDATGGAVQSLSEAVMGITAGLVQVAEAIRELAEAVRESNG